MAQPKAKPANASDEAKNEAGKDDAATQTNPPADEDASQVDSSSQAPSTEGGEDPKPDTENEQKPQSREEARKETAAQAAASTRSGGIAGPKDPEPDGEDQQEAQSLASETAATLEDLDRSSLVALNQAVENALRGKGEDPEGVGGPTLREQVTSIPTNDEATQKLGLAGAVRALDGNNDHDNKAVAESDIVAFSVKQATGAAGVPVGIKYVVGVTREGEKLITKVSR